MKTAEWFWAPSDPNGGTDGSSMTKLFRGGMLNDTALLAREALQNSTDAARTYEKTHPGVPFRVVFRFVDLYGAEKAAAVESFNLRRLAQRRAEYLNDPLQPGSVLDSLDDPRVALPLLYVEDFGTHGLYGSIHIGKKSHLFKAMYYLGASDKAADEGGSYGFGKSALMRASRVRSVIAHSTFEQYHDDPVRTRLVGFTWWPDLQEDDTLWNGRLSFSDHEELAGARHIESPFEDERANEIAAELGFQERDADDAGQLGSSFLIIDPAVDPDELVTEIEKWWWPALEENRLDVQVVLPSDEVRVPRPAKNPYVAQFLRAFRIATGLDEPSDPNRERLASNEWRDRSGLGGKDLGSLALVVHEIPADGQEDDLEPAPLVALMRSPRMVIKYDKVGRSRIPLRGVFVASEKIDVLLRDTEPSSHDQWTKNPSADLAAEATETARTVLEKIQSSVRRMASEITPAPPKANKALAHFAKLMSGFLGNKRGPVSPPTPGGEKIELTFPNGRPALSVDDDDNVSINATFSVRAADAAENDQCEVRVSCQLFIHEDESQSQAAWPLELSLLTAESGFLRDEDGSWSGLITKAESVLFKVKSTPYPNLWTTSLQPSVTRVGEWSAS